MSEMINTVAAALREATGGNVHMHHEGVARHVLTGIRKPTDAMITAGRIELGKDDKGGTVYLQGGEAEQVWEAMIDEALK